MALGFEKSKCLKMDEPSSAPAVPLQQTPALDGPSDARVQIMYCKELVYQGDAEFSLEELRAQRYFKALSEKALHLNRLKQDLQLQIEQKLLQQRNSSAAPQQVVQEEVDSSVQTSAGSCESATKSAPLIIYSDQDERRVDTSKSSVSREDDVNQSDSDVKPQKTVTAKPFTIFDEKNQANKISSSANRKSLKLPTLGLKGPKPKMDLSADKEVSISRSEEPILNAHWNKSVCRSPDDTHEFARATQLASTPFAGVERPKPDTRSPALPECTAAANTEPPPEEKKLSPILEISQEWGSTSFANFSQDPKRNGAETSCCVERPELENVSRSDDVFAPDVRSRLLDQVDVTSFSNFHQKAGLLPDTSHDLELDGDRLFYCRQIKDFSLYSSRNSSVLLKTDSSRLSWDFFIASQLISRRSHDDHMTADVQVSCHAYENGCLTAWTLSPGQTLQDHVCESTSGLDASLLVLRVLELIRCFHSCRLILGRLEPETLFVHSSGITALDLSDCVDLELQTDVSTAQDLPAALEDIQHGRLSPTASPYQADLLSAARLSHQLLFSRALSVTRVESGWRLQEDSGAPVEPIWTDFFHLLLNPDKPSVQVLSDLIQTVRSNL